MTHPFAPPERTYLSRAIAAHVPRKVLRDLWNQVRFGPQAPLSDMAIYPRPRAILERHKPAAGRGLRRHESGRVLAGTWDQFRESIETSLKFQSCRMHWVDGADWEETPTFQRMLRGLANGKHPDGCRSAEDVSLRYRLLDKLFEETKSRGRLLPMERLPGFLRRSHGATLVHVARDGTCLRSGGGEHRFAIAHILDLPEMPAHVGAIHPDAIRDGHFQRLCQSRFAED